MPNYEFVCETCGTFERWRDHRESGEPMPCPSCGAVARRVYSMPRFNVTTKSRAGARPPDEPDPRAGVVKRPESRGTQGPRRVGGRPWQVGH